MSGGHSPFNRWASGMRTKVRYNIKQESLSFQTGFSKKGDDILSHIIAVPSAQAGLTSLFGMGRGEPRRNNHLKSLVALGNLFAVLLLKKPNTN